MKSRRVYEASFYIYASTSTKYFMVYFIVIHNVDYQIIVKQTLRTVKINAVKHFYIKYK